MVNIARMAAGAFALALGAVVITGCAGDDDGPGTGSTDPTTVVTEADQRGPIDDVAMTVESLCGPLDDVVVNWVGAGAETQHRDLFANDDPASLVCQWQAAPEYREIRVTYHASPAVWDATVAAGGEPLDAVESDNRYGGQILSVHADNDWTIDVVAYEGDPPDYAEAPDVVASVANAALAATAAR